MNATLQIGHSPRSSGDRGITNPEGECCTDEMQEEARAERAEVEALLGKLLRYENHAVVKKLARNLKCSEEEAIQLFKDTMRFLWLAYKVGGIIPTKRIDEGWHTFILFTKDYAEFCEKYFGHFMHHRPNRPEDPPDDGSGLKRTIARVKEHLGENLSPNWDYENTAACWFQTGCNSGCREYCRDEKS